MIKIGMKCHVTVENQTLKRTSHENRQIDEVNSFITQWDSFPPFSRYQVALVYRELLASSADKSKLAI